MTPSTDHGTALHQYLQVIRRRKWIILSITLLAGALALLHALQQTPQYEASAKVLLSRTNLANSLTGVQDPTIFFDDQTLVKTQAEFARAPEIGDRVVTRLGLETSPDEFLANSSVSTSPSSDILTFSVRTSDPDLAAREATEYARQYTSYRHERDTAALRSAREEVRRKIDQLVVAGETQGPLYASLVRQEQRLQTMEALQTSNATVIQTAGGASKVSPTPVQDTVKGLLLGLILGLGLAFLVEGLDTRLRNPSEISERLGLPLLGRIPSPSKEQSEQNRLAMLDDPSGLHAESFRMLRTNLEFAMIDHTIRSIMITSAVEKEGKSTTIANLAVAFARAGKRVVLLDLDLRKPSLDRFFQLSGRAGIMEVLRGRPLDETLVSVPILPNAGETENGEILPVQVPTVSGNGAGGSLEVLTSGQIPPNPGELIGSEALSNILTQLREGVDLILIDSPPLLHVGDPMTLSAKVDAVIVAARLQLLRRSTVAEAHRLLLTVRASKLGFALTASDAERGYGYGHGYGYRYSERPHHVEEPVA